MAFRIDCSDRSFEEWLSQLLSEDELRAAYLQLEKAKADLWTPGHIDSFRRDRFELDSRYVARLVRVKRALADHWAATGQLDRSFGEPQLI